MSPSSSTWGDAQTKAQLGKLREAERLYLRAAEAAGNGSIKRMILAQVPELEDEGNAQVGVQYSLKVREINGTSHVANPYTTSREDVVKYLEMSLHRRLEDHTYFPVSAHTPDVLIATLQAAGINITDKPMAMQATKARQSQMEDEVPEKNKMKVRYHAMKPGEILEVIDKLSHPDVVIHQADRIKKVIVNGKETIVPAPDNFAVFVTIDSGKECVAIIEFDSKMGKDDIIYDGQGEEYHTTVTVFEPDVVWKGLPFDYVEYLLLNPNNRELDIKTESPQSDAAYGETLATTSNQGLSDNSIPQNSDLSTENAKKVSDDGGTAQFSRKAVAAAENYQSSTEKGAKQQTGDGLARKQAKAQMSKEEIQSGENVADFIDSVSHMLDQSKRSKRKMRIGEVSDAHVQIVDSLMKTVIPDFSAKEYELWIDGTGANHIALRHGEEGKHDKSMASREDRMLIPWVANSPDGGDFVRDANGKIELSNRFFNADGSKAPQIRLYKGVGGATVYVSECVPNAKEKRIYITSAYRKSSTNQLLNIDSVESPQPTSETSFDSGATKNIVPQEPDSVKRENSEGVKKQVKDSRGHALTAAQAEFFKDSKAVDEHGRLKVLYHGSNVAGFHIFAKSNDIGFYFTDKNKVAATYSGTRRHYTPKAKPGQTPADPAMAREASIETRTLDQAKSEAQKLGFRVGKAVTDGRYVLVDPNGRIVINDITWPSEVGAALEAYRQKQGGYRPGNYTVYLNLQNPLIIDGRGSRWESLADYNLARLDELTDEQKKAIYLNTGVLPRNMKSYDGLPAYDVKNNTIRPPRNMRDWVQEAADGGHDGVIIKDVIDDAAGGDAGSSTVYVAFEPEQIKSTANKSPTSNPDIRFSRKVDPAVAEAHREAAVERFGITNDFREAGFVLPDGSMLDFSGGIKGRRGDDHGKIRLIYDEELNGSQAIARFLSEGNVRISEMARGIEVGEGEGLTASQYNAISRFVSRMRDKGVFYVDYTREDGSEIGSATYEGNVSAEEVIWDIKDFYRSGEVRDPSSEVYFSRKQNDTGKQTIDSQEGIDTYTEEQYNNFGWVRDNDILSKESMAEFTSKFADAKKRRHVYPKNKRGEFMIAIEGEVRGVDNIIVFASGEMESPKISKVVSIFEYDGTELDKVRRIIYGAERRGVQPKAGNVCNIYFSTDFGYYEYQQRSVKASDQDREQLGEQRGRHREIAEGTEKSEVSDDVVVFSRKQQTSGDFSDLLASAGIVGEAVEIKSNLAELERMAKSADAGAKNVYIALDFSRVS